MSEDTSAEARGFAAPEVNLQARAPQVGTNKRALVTGAGGAIGGHLVLRLLNEGYSVRAVDIKPIEDWWQVHDSDNRCMDVRSTSESMLACTGVDEVYNLACNMGGIGFIEGHRADCALSVQIGISMLSAAVASSVPKFFYSSSACVYPTFLQTNASGVALKESDAWPAMPEAGYGEEKLFTEKLAKYISEDYGLDVRIARFHNVYGPHGAWTGGREKAPAAICRKVAEAKLSGEHSLEVWGDGTQSRSFMYVDDCIEGMLRLMASDHAEPLNLGSEELVSINRLVTIVSGIAGVDDMTIHHDLEAPQGVRGRNSDNTLIREVLSWEPEISLQDGLEKTYAWIEQRVSESARP